MTHLLAEMATERELRYPVQGKRGRPQAALPDLSEVPWQHRWPTASLEQATDPVRTISYGILKPGPNIQNGVPYVRVLNMREDVLDVAGLHRTTPEIAMQYARASLAPDDVLVSIRGTFGRVVLVPASLAGANITQDTARLAFLPQIQPRFAALFLRSPIAQRYLKRVARGVAVKGVNIGDLRTLPLPVPPLTEQQEIVEILEDHLSRLDAAATDVSGAARRLHLLEPAWLHQRLGTLTACEKVPLGELARDSGYGTSTKCVVDGGGPPVVRIPNLIDGRVDLTDEKRVRDASVDVSGAMLRAGDLLFVRTNGSRDLIGRTAVVQEGIDAAFASYLIRYRLDTTRVLPGWAHLVMQAPSTRAQLESMAASSAGQYNLSLGKLDQIEVPVPTIDEQERQIDSASDLHNHAVRLWAGVSSSEHRLGALRRALLSAAFTGRLAPNSRRLQDLASV